MLVASTTTFTPAHCYVMINHHAVVPHRQQKEQLGRFFNQQTSTMPWLSQQQKQKSSTVVVQSSFRSTINQQSSYPIVAPLFMMGKTASVEKTSSRLSLAAISYPSKRRQNRFESLSGTEKSFSVGFSFLMNLRRGLPTSNSMKDCPGGRRDSFYYSWTSSNTSRRQTETDSMSIQQTSGDIKEGDDDADDSSDVVRNNSSSAANSADDGGEWNAIIDAFSMYKAAYGNLKIPARFIVPSMPPWPKEAWGMRLGHKVAAIRSTGKHVQNSASRRKQLEQMGFVWRLRAPSAKATDSKLGDITFEQIYSAIETYKDIHGDLNIPNSFVVPDVDPWKDNTRGMPLGRKLSALRSKEFLKNNPSKERKLRKLGLPLIDTSAKTAVNDVRYQKVYQALAKYKEIHGDLLVPQPFVVPDGDPNWPDEMWGLRLGARVNAIRSQGTFVNAVPERKDELDALGFVWDYPVNERGKKRGRKKKEPLSFMGSAPFPLSGSGSPQDEQQQQSLSSLGGSGESPFGLGLSPSAGGEDSIRQAWNNQMNNASPDAAARTWRDPQQQVPMIGGLPAGEKPSDESSERSNHILDPNTVEERSLAIGIESGIFSGVDPVSKIAKVNLRRVNHPWIFDDYGDNFEFENVVEALKIWGDHYNGTFDNIHEDFVITEQLSSTFNFDEAPPALAPSSTSRVDGIVEDDTSSSSIGIDDEEEEDEDDEGASDIIVHKETVQLPTFPPHLVGLMLGSIVKRIREGDVEVKIDPDRKAQLDGIGFDWGDSQFFSDVPFEKAMCALLAYYQIRGDLFVDAEFNMPGDDPWPRILEGYPIGEVVIQLRQKQLWFEEYFPEKKSMLDMLEFVWFPVYESKLSDFEMEHMERFGTPQPSRETLETMFPRPEEYWDVNNPPIFNFTLAEELIEEQIDQLERGAVDEDWDEDVRSEEEAGDADDEQEEEEEKSNDDVQLEWENDDEELDDEALLEFDEAVYQQLEEESATTTNVPLKNELSSSS